MRLNILIILVINFFTLNAQVVFKGKIPHYSFYPEEYKIYTENNFDKAKQVLDSALAFRNINTLRNAEAGIKSWFILARLVDINWNISHRREVSNYLKSFVEQIIGKTSFVKDFTNLNHSNKTFLEYDPAFLPHKALWASLLINEQVACSSMLNIWSQKTSIADSAYINSLKLAILWSIEKKPKIDEVYNCLMSILAFNDPVLSSAEYSRLINNFLLKHRIYKLNSESKAWNYMWSNSGANMSGNIFTEEIQSMWMRRVLIMKEVYTDPDVQVLLNMVENELDFNKKYIFLYCATFLVNNKKSIDPQHVDRTKVDRLKSLVENLYTSVSPNNTRITSNVNNRDFLKTAFDLIK